MNSLIIEASAGSGKTFQLSNRFIALLVLEQNPGDLIALTFTRKAAGEFARRILNRLAKGACDEASAAALTKEITPTLIGDPATGQPGLGASTEVLQGLNVERYRDLLQGVIAELDRLQLSTLDSFFTRLVRAFGPELGITSFEMLDEDAHKQEQEKAMLAVLKSHQLNDRQRELFLKSFDFATLGKDEMKVSELIMEFIQDHHYRFLKASQPENWGNPAKLFPNSPPPTIIPTSALLEMAEEITTVSETLDFGHKGLNGTIEKFVATIADYHPGTPIPDSFKYLFKWTSGFQAGDEIVFNYYRKDRHFGMPLSRLLIALRDAVVDSEIAVILARTQGIWAVIAAFETTYNQQARKRGRLGFSDISLILEQHTLLAERAGFNPLAYRLDSKFHHWMLDEFQDTSRQQFDIIEPVISEAVDDPDAERSLFVVGDTKQAIYGWRSGEPRLMQEMRDRWHSLMDWTMSQSYRSSQSVLDFVNLCCNPHGSAMQMLFPPAALERWRFQPHTAAKDLTGSALVYEVPKGIADESESSPVQLATLALIEEMEPTDRGLSCAILVSSNAKVAKMAAFLRHHTNYPIETDGTVPVSQDNPLGLALLDWFRYLVHPSDSFAKRHIELSPLLAAIQHLGETPGKAWRPARTEISRQGIAHHLGIIAKQLRQHIELGEFQELRLQQILDAAGEFDARGGKVEDWLLKLSSLTRSESSQSGSIQVMTVHKSKGLEFDVVILPDLDTSSFDDANKVPVLTAENEQNLPEHYLLRPKKDIVDASPELRHLFDEWTASNCFERFCNFYVALTRAARSVICLVQPRSQKDQKEGSYRMNPSGWIHASVGDIETSDETLGRTQPVELKRLFENGDPQWFSSEQAKVLDEDQLPIEVPKLSTPTPRQASRTASGDKGKSSFAHRSTRASRSAMAFGNEVHAIFESIYRWENQALPETEAGKLVKACLELPESAAWFSPSQSTEILNEQAIEAVDPDGSWFSGVIDRVLIERDPSGQATHIRILDYKTDRIKTPEELIKRYQPQLKSYLNSIALAEKVSPSQIQAQLFSTHLLAYINVAN